VKKLLAAIVALLLLVGFTAYAYFTPQLTLKKIQAAAVASNTTELVQHIDFPAIRESLKAQIKARIDQGAHGSANPFAALGSALAGALAEPAIDALVTPENLANLLSGEGFGGTQGPRIRLQGDDLDMGYEGLHTFVVSGDSGTGFRLVMEREGVLSWKLTDVQLPDSWTLPAPSTTRPRL